MFFSIPNLSSQTVREMPHPENYTYQHGNLPFVGDKAAFNLWSNELTTDHSYISMFEGMSPCVRVESKDNPAVKMYGIHVDYDSPMQKDFLEFLEKHPQSEFRPMWLSTSRNGKCRLTWLFEVAANLMSHDHWKHVIRRLTKELHFFKWHAGLDEPALGDPSRYYEHGTNWTCIPSGKPIPASLLAQWFFEAGLSCNTGHKAFNYEIPMEEIAAEVHARFPGRWKGEFRIGAQGCRFWDPSADAPKGAWIRKDGVFCFTGESRFLPWVEILGKEFMSKYAMRAIDDILETTAYDGKAFWQPNEEGDWEKVPKDDFTEDLRVKGYSASKPKGETASAVDKVSNAIKRQRRIENAFPFLFYPRGMMTWEGERYVNTTKVRVMEPAVPVTVDRMEFTDGPNFFPLIHKLLTNMFVEPGDTKQDQLFAFLAWLKYFYCNALAGIPRPGHAIVIAGPAGKGKTFLTERIVGGLMGGTKDATFHVVNGNQFTARLAKSPVMTIDDAQGVTDSNKKRQFSAMVKKYVSNPEIDCNEKHEKAGFVPWFGRLMILCNLDSLSLRIIPDMDISIRDKISLFKASNFIISFGEREDNNRRVAAELPYFARFLADWVLPEELISTEKRFGVCTYHHEELLMESMQQGHSTLLELLERFLPDFKEKKPGQAAWTGTAAELHNELSLLNPGAMRELPHKILGMQLAGLAKNGYGVASVMKRTGTKTWTINYNLMKDSEVIL